MTMLLRHRSDVFQMLLDVLESDDVLTCLLSLLNRTDESERWSVNSL